MSADLIAGAVFFVVMVLVIFRLLKPPKRPDIDQQTTLPDLGPDNDRKHW